MLCFRGNPPRGYLVGCVVPVLGLSSSQGPPRENEASQPRFPSDLCLPGAGEILVALEGGWQPGETLVLDPGIQQAEEI